MEIRRERETKREQQGSKYSEPVSGASLRTRLLVAGRGPAFWEGRAHTMQEWKCLGSVFIYC